MNHLSEEQLVEHYYHEGGGSNATAAHLAGCASCAAAYAALGEDLDGIDAIEPELDGGYGARVWNQVADDLPRYQREPWLSRYTGGRRIFVYGAAACVLLVTGAFYAGRLWDRPDQSANPAAVAVPVQSKVVLVVIGDHLDRSERLLVELKHAGEDADLASPMRDEARRLLASNEACRRDATELGDPALAAALGRLEALLADVANHPESPSFAEMNRLRSERDIESLLFEVRVLRSRMPEPSHSSGGAI